MRTLLRAGRAMLAALASSTGPRRPARRLPRVLGGVALVGVGGAAWALATPTADMPAPERARIEAVVHDYILAHPEIIPQAMERLQQKRASDAAAENLAAIETPYAGAWEGAADGDVTLVEFFDYACGYCRASAPDVARLLVEDKRLKVVYRELPILGDQSVVAARVALLAAESGHYPAFHRAMYAGTGVDRAAVTAAADAAGLDPAKVRAILASRTMPEEFKTNVALAQALNASGTPLFVVGGEVLNGAVGYDALKAAVAKARGAKKAGG